MIIFYAFLITNNISYIVYNFFLHVIASKLQESS